jgi:dTDP-glucose pyrophosphorylase/CBS domain-containing protein
MRDVSQLFVSLESPISEAIKAIDRSGRISIALVVDEQRRLLNTISDGDVRRGILAGCALTDAVSRLIEIKARTPYPVPVMAPADGDPESFLKIMQDRSVRQVPLLDAEGAVVDIVILSDYLPQVAKTFRAVVMAGGQGMRLRPLTEDTPKPMLPVGGRPVMERIVEQLRDVGVKHIHVSTHFQAEKIMQHFGKGESFGVEIEYVNEEVPLGTGGALGLMDTPTEPVLVINGDVLTQVDFQSMFTFHQDHRADMTVGVRRYEMQVPYGVVDCEGAHIKALREKPQLSFFVNAGIYLLEPTVFRHIPGHRHMQMTDLIQTLIERGMSVISFPICEYWLDIGQHADYEQAQEDAQKGGLLFVRSRPIGAP